MTNSGTTVCYAIAMEFTFRFRVGPHDFFNRPDMIRDASFHRERVLGDFPSTPAFLDQQIVQFPAARVQLVATPVEFRQIHLAIPLNPQLVPEQGFGWMTRRIVDLPHRAAQFLGRVRHSPEFSIGHGEILLPRASPERA